MLLFAVASAFFREENHALNFIVHGIAISFMIACLTTALQTRCDVPPPDLAAAGFPLPEGIRF